MGSGADSGLNRCNRTTAKHSRLVRSKGEQAALHLNDTWMTSSLQIPPADKPGALAAGRKGDAPDCPRAACASPLCRGPHAGWLLPVARVTNRCGLGWAGSALTCWLLPTPIPKHPTVAACQAHPQPQPPFLQPFHTRLPGWINAHF